ncbi:MAG: CoA transferase [Actinomycetales bacterium]
MTSRCEWPMMPGPSGAVELTDSRDDLLPSPLPCLDIMTAAASAALLAIADLDVARTRATERPLVTLDLTHLAIASTSERYAPRRLPTGGEQTELFAPLSRFWQTSDGWIRLHGNYPWHRDRALHVLACRNDPDSIAAAIRQWRAEDLEEALSAAGAVAGAVRTVEQWRRHPQGQASAVRPLTQQTAAGRPRALPTGRFLEGVRVLDLTRVIAGPVGTKTLAAWGADVLRLDAPHLPELPLQALDTLPGKRSAALDLREPAAREVLDELLAAADVLVMGYRPGSLEALGLDDAHLLAAHPHLTTVRLSAWGDGPWQRRRGFDSIVQAVSGIADLTGEHGQPGVLPAQVLDHATGYLVAAAAARSLAAVASGRPPLHTRLALASTAQWLLDSRTPSDRLSVSETRTAPSLPSPDPYLVALSGPAGEVQVVGPVGKIGPTGPRWTSTTELGHDAAVFA